MNKFTEHGWLKAPNKDTNNWAKVANDKQAFVLQCKNGGLLVRIGGKNGHVWHMAEGHIWTRTADEKLHTGEVHVLDADYGETYYHAQTQGDK